MRHGKAMAATMSCLMSEECAEGNLNSDWQIEKPMTKKQFRKVLAAKQMCEYRTFSLNYPGDEMMRQTTQRNKVMRGWKRKRSMPLGR